MGSGRFVEVIEGNDLRAKRKIAGLTLRELATRAGKPQAYAFLARLERNERHTLTPEFAWALIETLGIEPHEIKHYFRFHGFGAVSRDKRAA